jgi:hypothetical protein
MMVINLKKVGNYKVMNAKLLLITVELPLITIEFTSNCYRMTFDYCRITSDYLTNLPKRSQLR